MGKNVRFAFKRVLRFKRILNQNRATAANVIVLGESKSKRNRNVRDSRESKRNANQNARPQAAPNIQESQGDQSTSMTNRNLSKRRSERAPDC